MNQLQKIMNLCKSSVSLKVNEHKDYYIEIKDYLDGLSDLYEDVDKEVLQGIIKRDCIIELQFYPDTPIGSYSLCHYDLDKILDQALGILKE